MKNFRNKQILENKFYLAIININKKDKSLCFMIKILIMYFYQLYSL